MRTELNVKLLSYTPEPEKLISAAAKLCYSDVSGEKIMEDLNEEKAKKFLDFLMDLGHESPIEHVSFSFSIEGVSRVLTHQLVRHRIASYSQRSQRYVQEGQFHYIIPPEIEDINEAKEIFVQQMEKDQEVYYKLSDILYKKHFADFNKNNSEKEASRLAQKKAIEDARYVLPNSCETKIMVTMNARSLIHFFNLRCCNRAQWEIREMADQMLIEVKKVAPNLFNNIGPRCLKGPCPEGKMTCGEIVKVREKYKKL
jgi:thymidylate synthase (FAD)